MAHVEATAPVQQLLDRLKKVRRSGNEWVACCPAHDDGNPSLAISVGSDGRAIVHCHSAGCSHKQIAEAVGLTEADLFMEPREPRRVGLQLVTEKKPLGRPRLIASYPYVDEDGGLLYEACRLEYDAPEGVKPKKTFRQRRPDPAKPGDWIWDAEGVRLVPYRLPELIEAVAHGRPIYIPEGEKHVDALMAYRFAATCNVGGAGKWRDEYSKVIAGADVIVLADNDDIGRKHAEQVAVSCHAQGCRVRVVHLKEIWPEIPEKGDIVDWIKRDADHSEDLDVFGALCDRTPLWRPEALRNRVQTRWRADDLVLNDEIMRPPSALIPRVVWRSRSTLLAGLQKLGKSTLLGYLTMCASRGEPFLDPECCETGDILYISIDEYLGDTVRRLSHFEANLRRVHIVRELLGDTVEQRLTEIRQHIDETSPMLVILDSLFKFGRGLVDKENDAVFGEIAYALTDIAHDTDVGLIITHHGRRSDGRARGSGQIMAGVDVVCEFLQPEEEKAARPNLRRMESVGRVPLVPRYDFLYSGKSYYLDGGPTRELPIDEQLLAYVRNHPGCSGRDARESVRGKRTADVDAALRRLLTSGRVSNGGTNRAGKLYVPGSEPQPSFAPSDPQRRVAEAEGRVSSGNRSEPLGNHSGNHPDLEDPF